MGQTKIESFKKGFFDLPKDKDVPKDVPKDDPYKVFKDLFSDHNKLANTEIVKLQDIKQEYKKVKI